MLLTFLRQHWDRFLDSPCPRDLQVASITSCLHDYGNDLALVFADGGDKPSHIMKIVRSARYGFKLEREFAALRRVAENHRLRSVVPAAHHLGLFGGRTFFIQQGIDGASLSRLIHDRGLSRTNRNLLEQAVDLLVEINSQATLAEPAADIEDDSALTLDSAESERLATRRSELSRAPSGYYLHGDYWPNNLLIRNKRIVGIVDWEFAQPCARLPTDIISFLINLGYVIGTAAAPQVSVEESYRRAFFRRGKCSELLSSLCGRYFAAGGLDGALLLPLLEASLSQLAKRELTTYGRHGKMDAAYLDMLRYTLRHEGSLRIRPLG